MAKMADDICMFTKCAILIRSTKKAPLLFRMALLLFAVVCGIYICTICSKQVTIRSDIKGQEVQVIKTPIDDKKTQLSVKPDLHYPKPETFNRAECVNNAVRFFVIISMQRSGSGWFETLLNSHTNVSCNGEIFFHDVRRQNSSAIIQTLDKVYNLDWFSSASKNECSAAVGLKWMLNQGLMEYHKEIVQYFNNRGVSIIFLFRRNLLRRMVSLLANSYDQCTKILNGTHKAHVHSPEEANRLSAYKPSINSKTLITDLKQMEETAYRAFKYFNSTRHIVLYYEDLIKNHTKIQDVLEFLDLPQMELKSRQVKIHKGPLSKHVKNWDDVNKTLTGTRYESFLHADYNKIVY